MSLPESEQRSNSPQEFTSIRIEPPNNNNVQTSGQVTDTFTCVRKQFSQYSEIQTEGYNCIYKATRFGKWYILKGLKPQFRNDSAYKLMLAKEFEISVSLHHPNIIQVIGKEEDPIIGPCIVMEYVDGQTLNECLQRVRNCKNVRRIVMQILKAMDYMHGKNIVHRDLKPENILISRKNNEVKIIDFGLADSESYDFYKKIAGDSPYLAPEMLESDYIQDSRSDLYSFGKILECFGKRYLYISRKCTRSNPNARFSSARSIINFIRYRTIVLVSLFLLIFFELLLLANIFMLSTYFK